MKIVFVLEHYYPYLGGAEKLFRQLAEEFVLAGHQIIVVTTQFRTDLSRRENIAGVEVYRVACQSRFLFTVLSIPLIWQAVQRADVVLTTTYNAALPAWLVTRIRRIKTLLVFHERWGKLWFELPYLKMWERFAYASFEWVITRLPFEHYVAVSVATKQALITGGIPSGKIQHIYNGLKYEDYNELEWQPDSGEFKLLYFGRLGISKGLDLILPAWAAFVRKFAKGCLQLVIPTYPAGLYQQIIKDLKELDIPPKHLIIQHELEREKLFQLVTRADAVLIPSYSEGFCFVAAETMAIGTPIISSGRGALAEVVGGKYVEMEAQNADALALAMEDVYFERWIDAPQQQFPLEQSIHAYFKLLNRLGEE